MTRRQDAGQCADVEQLLGPREERRRRRRRRAGRLHGGHRVHELFEVGCDRARSVRPDRDVGVRRVRHGRGGGSRLAGARWITRPVPTGRAAGAQERRGGTRGMRMGCGVSERARLAIRLRLDPPGLSLGLLGRPSRPRARRGTGTGPSSPLRGRPAFDGSAPSGTLPQRPSGAAGQRGLVPCGRRHHAIVAPRIAWTPGKPDENLLSIRIMVVRVLT